MQFRNQLNLAADDGYTNYSLLDTRTRLVRSRWLKLPVMWTSRSSISHYTRPSTPPQAHYDHPSWEILGLDDVFAAGLDKGFWWVSCVVWYDVYPINQKASFVSEDLLPIEGLLPPYRSLYSYFCFSFCSGKDRGFLAQMHQVSSPLVFRSCDVTYIGGVGPATSTVWILRPNLLN